MCSSCLTTTPLAECACSSWSSLSASPSHGFTVSCVYSTFISLRKPPPKKKNNSRKTLFMILSLVCNFFWKSVKVVLLIVSCFILIIFFRLQVPTSSMTTLRKWLDTGPVCGGRPAGWFSLHSSWPWVSSLANAHDLLNIVSTHHVGVGMYLSVNDALLIFTATWWCKCFLWKRLKGCYKKEVLKECTRAFRSKGNYWFSICSW